MGTLEKCCSSHFNSDDVNEIKNVEIDENKTMSDLKLEEFRIKMKNLHNQLRLIFRFNELEEKKELDSLAQKYAIKLSQNYNKNFFYYPNKYKGKYLGENIAISHFDSPEEIFDIWKKEIKDYLFKFELSISNNNIKDYNTNIKNYSLISHYSQIIWKETTHIGIGFHQDKNNNLYYTVVLYYPIGNIFGEFPSNIVEEIKEFY